MLKNVLSCSGKRIYTCLFVPMKTRYQPSVLAAPTQLLHTTADRRKREITLSQRQEMKSVDIRAQRQDDLSELRLRTLEQENNFDAFFPTEDTPDLIVHGVKYKDLPVVYIQATSNNTIITLATAEGKTIKTSSGGCVGFKNRRESTPVAAQVATVAVAKEAKREGIYAVRVALKGIGKGREAGLKALVTAGLSVVSITDVTPLPFNGNRPSKKRSL